MSETILKETTNLINNSTRYLTFFLGDEEYGLEIEFVKEIIGVLCVTPVPRSMNHILGVINLRGRVVPVIDLRLNFGLPKCEPTERSCIIVIEYDNELVGLLVDEVSEVLNIRVNAVDKSTLQDQNVNEQYLQGIVMVDGDIKILLNIKNLLDCE